MRALKTILIILGALVGLWLLLCLFGAKASHVERTKQVKAAPETIYGYIRYLKNMDEWGVWRKSDPQAKYEFSGEDGTVGAKRSWDGEVVSQGSNTLTGLEPNKSVKSDLAFGSMVSQLSLDLRPNGDSTEVKWTMHGETTFLFRAMNVLMSMDKMIGPDFETGLGNLKTICEAKQMEADKAKAAEPTYTIATTDRPAKLYVGKREVVKWADRKELYTKNLGANMAAVRKAGVQPAGASSGVYFEWNEKYMTADLIAGTPVPSDAKGKLKGLDLYETPASKALVIDYYGGYNGLGKAHAAMDAYLKANTQFVHHTNVIEEYLTDPGSEPDSSKWLTRITYLVK